jgi:hypothetical protein
MCSKENCSKENCSKENCSKENCSKENCSKENCSKENVFERKIVRRIHLKQFSLFSAGLSHCVSLEKFHLFHSKSGICFKLKERLSGLSGMNELKPKVCLQYFTRKHYIGEDIREGASFRKKLNF